MFDPSYKNTAILRSRKTFENLTMSHNAVYLSEEYQGTAFSEEIIKAAEGLFDIRYTAHPIYRGNPSEITEKAAALGGVADGDMILSGDLTFQESVICTGTVTVPEGRTLTLTKGKPLIAGNLILKGQIRIEGDTLTVKPGTPIGKKGEDTGNQGALVITDTLTFAGEKSALYGEVTAYASRAVVKTQASLTGMFSCEDFTAEEGAKILLKNGWIGAVSMDFRDHVRLDVCAAEICVLEYIHKDHSDGYYDHTGYGRTIVGKDVTVRGPKDGFQWLWFGKTEGEFSDVTGDVTLKTKAYTLANRADMENIIAGPIRKRNGSGHEYEVFWHEKDPEHLYLSTRQRAVEAVMFNLAAEKFPDSFQFPIMDAIYGWPNRLLRPANILIHTANDLETIGAFAEFIMYFTEEKQAADIL